MTQINLKFIQEKNQLESQLSKLRNRMQEKEIKSILVMIEVERLYNVIEEKDAERETMREKMMDLENNNTGQLEDYKRQFENMFKSRIVSECCRASINML